MKRISRGISGPRIIAAACVAAALLALPGIIDGTATAIQRDRLQTVADRVALTSLRLESASDEDALMRSLAANGIDDTMITSSLRRYESGGGRASEVVMRHHYRLPLGFLHARSGETLEVTSRAITWTDAGER